MGGIRMRSWVREIARAHGGALAVVLAALLLAASLGLLNATRDCAWAEDAQGTLAAGGSESADDEAYVPGEILVTFNDDLSAKEQGKVALRIQGVDEESPFADGALQPSLEDESAITVVKLADGAGVEEAVEAAMATPGVEAAQPNYRYQLLDATPVENPLTNDPALAYYDPKADENAWHLQAINIEGAWNKVKTQGAVTVAVLDTGCDISHEDLKSNVLREYAWDAYRHDTLTCDYYGHGTHVAGCIAAEAGNGKGTAGSSYNAKILPINVFDEYGSDKWASTTKSLVDAYDYLLEFNEKHPEYNLHVVNMSLGGYDNSSADDVAFQQRISKAKDCGIISICAGGNGDGYGNPLTAHSYPSDYDDCLAVTALSTDGKTPTTWCDYNNAKDICSPNN